MSLGLIIALLACAVLSTLVCQRLKVPHIVAYIVVGILLGPGALGIFRESTTISGIAEFGIVFLLFMIGLEFSLSRLISMKRTVFLFGGLQVILSISITALIGTAVKMSLQQLFIVGAIVAMSSTAIVSKLLTDQAELNTQHGQDAIALLLFQDLAVIPILMILPSLSNGDAGALGLQVGLALTKGVIAILLILFLGRTLFQRLFYSIAKTRSLELFTLTALCITLGAAWLTHYAGLSMELGAFISGILLGETDFKHQIENDLRPFRDVLLGLFFITIGIMLDVTIIWKAWQWVLILFLALIIFKIILITSLSLLFKRHRHTAMRTGFILAQGSEFSFVILSLSLQYKLLPDDYSQVILSALLLSLAMAPFLIQYNRKLTDFILGEKQKTSDNKIANLSSIAKDLNQHVIICGFGRVGQNIARLLKQANVPYIALDLDPATVADAQALAENVFYADASHHRILTAAGVDRAKFLAVSFYGKHTINKILQEAKQLNPDIKLYVRSYDATEIDDYYANGASEVIPENLEASLVLVSHILLQLQIPATEVHNLLHRNRQNRYQLLRN